MVMLLVASALVTRPHLAAHRFKILTALWCRYKDVSEAALQQEQLVDWFTFGLFGRHTTVREVETWSKGCEKWLRGLEAGGFKTP
jgi:hypothetical protein